MAREPGNFARGRIRRMGPLSWEGVNSMIDSRALLVRQERFEHFRLGAVPNGSAPCHRTRHEP